MAISTYQNQLEIPHIANVVFEDVYGNTPIYCNHIELSSTTVFAVYGDNTNGIHKCKVGVRVSDACIEWGAEYAMNTSLASYVIPVRVSDTKVLITYRDNGNSNQGTAVCCTISGTVVTFGAEAIYLAVPCIPIGAVLLDTDKVLIAYANQTINGVAIIATLSGTTISYGNNFIFKATTDITGSIADAPMQLAGLSTSSAVVVYRVSSTVTNCQILSISGTTITGNAEYTLAGSTDKFYPSICSFNANQFVMGYTDSSNSFFYTHAGTVSGGAITLGTALSTDSGVTATRRSSIVAISYTSSPAFAVIFQGTTQNLKCKIGTISGTTITLGSELMFVNTNGNNPVLYPMYSNIANLKLTYTKNRQLTFSYIFNSSQYIMGMLMYDGLALKVKGMCYRIASAGNGEQVEISSIWATAPAYGFGTSSGEFELYFNGTSEGNAIYRNSVGDQFSIGTGVSNPVTKSIIMTLQNCPIILTQNQTLYASTLSTDNSQFKRNAVTVFGIKRT